MFTYFFEGIAFIPGYNDTDFFQSEITAESQEEAEKKLKSQYQYMKGWTLVDVQPVESQESA